MHAYRTLAIPTQIAEAVRVSRVSPQYGHPVHAEVATGYGPCRLCLDKFTAGADRRLLFTYDPFDGYESLPLPGPVFVHEAGCERWDEHAGFPEQLRGLLLTLNAYARGRRLIAQEYVADGAVAPVLQRLLAHPELAFIHVRNTEAGCFMFTVEPVESQIPRP
ncbi:MAG: DUF1203 domain-containing protein [Gemmatimonadetes bacterium]|nr:DUF1203 domain-containing protein [Gemmatimonadota bacterium]